MATVTIDFVAELTRFSSNIDRMSNDLSKFQTNATRMQKNVTRVFHGLAAAIPAGLFINFIKGTIDAADNLNDLSKRTGVAISTLASYKIVSEQTGTNLEAVAKGISRLTLSISQGAKGNTEMQESLRNLGITSKDPQKAFEQLAEKVKNTNDVTLIAADLQKVLSRNYTELIPLLMEGAGGLHAAALASKSFAEQMAALAPNADAFNDQLVVMKASTTGAAAAILVQMLPRMNEWMISVETLTKKYGALIGIIGGLGKLPFDLAIKNPKAAETSAARIKELRTELSELEGVKKRAKGTLLDLFFGTPEKLDRKITITKNQIAALEKIGDKVYKIEPKIAVVPKVDMSGELGPMFACIAKEDSIWDGKKCVKLKTKATAKTPPVKTLKIPNVPKPEIDPLEGLLSRTAVSRLDEATKSVDLLSERMAAGRIAPKQYAEALRLVEDEIKEIKNAAESIDIDAGSFFTTDPKVAEMISEQNDFLNESNRIIGEEGVQAAEDYRQAMKDLISDTTFAKTENFLATIEELDKLFFDGAVNADIYREKLKLITEGVPEQLQEVDSMAKQMGMSFSSAFEDAIIEGEKFSDVLQSLMDDILRIMLRTQVTSPLTKAIEGIDWGGMFKNILGGAEGGIFGPGVPMQKYARGGIVSSPQVAVYGEGSMNEAVVPLPDGRSIPVDMKGATAASVVVNVIEAPGSGGQTKDREANGMRVVDVFVEQIKAAVGGDIMTGGGAVSSALERTYGLSRSAGSY